MDTPSLSSLKLRVPLWHDIFCNHANFNLINCEENNLNCPKKEMELLNWDVPIKDHDKCEVTTGLPTVYSSKHGLK